MLDYSDHLLEISSSRKLDKSSESRVLDTRPWNHYIQLKTLVVYMLPKFVLINIHFIIRSFGTRLIDRITFFRNLGVVLSNNILSKLAGQSFEFIT
jgi:hypothetical protein